MASNPVQEDTWCAAAMDISGKNITIIKKDLKGLAEQPPAQAAFKRIYSTDSGNIWKVPSRPGTGEFPEDISQIGQGIFISGPAAAVSDDGKRLHVLGLGTDNKMYHASSANGGKTWDKDWRSIGELKFTSAPAAAVSSDGKKLHVFGRVPNGRLMHSSSSDAGATWDKRSKIIGLGKFTSAPAAAVAGFGMNLHVFGRGIDNKIWYTSSSRSGDDWGDQTNWHHIGQKTFDSAPAAAVSGSGKELHVFGRATDDRMWHAFSSDSGKDFDENTNWAAIGQGVFSSGPAAAVSADGKKLHVFGRGIEKPSSPADGIVFTFTPQIWRAFSNDGGKSWNVAWKAIGTGFGPA